MQATFKQELGIIVDKPKPGYGNCNDENSVRRFFENSEISAAITEVDKILIQRFYIKLETILCGFGTIIEFFQKYCIETARLLLNLYPWFVPACMPKILIYGSIVVKEAILPIALMSEETQETLNKNFKISRRNSPDKFPDFII